MFVETLCLSHALLDASLALGQAPQAWMGELPGTLQECNMPIYRNPACLTPQYA